MQDPEEEDSNEDFLHACLSKFLCCTHALKLTQAWGDCPAKPKNCKCKRVDTVTVESSDTEAELDKAPVSAGN